MFTEAKKKEAFEQLYVFGTLAVTAQKSSGKEIDVAIWDLDGESGAIMSFKPPLSSLKSVSQQNEMLCLAGKD